MGNMCNLCSRAILELSHGCGFKVNCGLGIVTLLLCAGKATILAFLEFLSYIRASRIILECNCLPVIEIVCLSGTDTLDIWTKAKLTINYFLIIDLFKPHYSSAR